MQFSGIFLVTTLPAPITELSPMLTPFNTIASVPISTLLPTQDFRDSDGCARGRRDKRVEANESQYPRL